MNLKSIFNPDRSVQDKIVLVEVTTGEKVILETLPAHFHIDGEISYGEHEETDIARGFYFEFYNGTVILKKGSIAPNLTCLLFGKEWEENIQLQKDVEYLLQMNNFLYVFRYACSSTSWVERMDFEKWHLFDLRDDSKSEEFTFPELWDYIKANQLDWNQMGVCIEGMEGAFSLKQFAFMPSFRNGDESEDSVFDEENYGEERIDATLDSDPEIDRTGPLLSPYCWERFDYGDILHIVEDERLLGDPVLGKAEFLRFSTTRFDHEGNAVDAYGNACVEIADPHTRHRLPQGFLELPQYIFSIIGAPGSGKSNYLSILINSLQNSLFNNFEMVLKDADPAHNAPLNDMKNCLFGGGSMEQAALLKTQLDGKMYLKIKRDDRVLSYPRPFIYTLARSSDHEGLCNLVFYDNAGEHFEPGIETSISPGAQHITAADALFFLVDPTTLPAFRQRLLSHPDPQLRHQGRIDQQDVLLSELEIRIHKSLGLSVNEKIKKPLAILLGKCDIWMSLIDRTKFRQPIEGNLLSQDALLNNSNLVRQLLLELAPTIVANAESISNQVFYFPVSAFGHSPTQLPGGSLAPNPIRIKPYLIEIPTLWALSQKLPTAFKVRPKPPSSRLIPN
jgi:hypothetical protein